MTARSHSTPNGMARAHCATARSLAAASSSSLAQRARRARSAAVAQSLSVIASFQMRPFHQLAAQAGASANRGGSDRAYLKGSRGGIHHASSFAPVQPVIQPVIPWSFCIEAPMTQIPLRLLCRVDAPSVVPSEAIAQLTSYREAVRFCWAQRRRTKMTKAMLAEEAGLYGPHVTCYLAPEERTRDLPGSRIKSFEYVCGNTAISQWLALQGQLTVAEEAIADKQARVAA